MLLVKFKGSDTQNENNCFASLKKKRKSYDYGIHKCFTNMVKFP